MKADTRPHHDDYEVHGHPIRPYPPRVQRTESTTDGCARGCLIAVLVIIGVPVLTAAGLAILTFGAASFRADHAEVLERMEPESQDADDAGGSGGQATQEDPGE